MLLWPVTTSTYHRQLPPSLGPHPPSLPHLSPMIVEVHYPQLPLPALHPRQVQNYMVWHVLLELPCLHKESTLTKATLEVVHLLWVSIFKTTLHRYAAYTSVVVSTMWDFTCDHTSGGLCQASPFYVVSFPDHCPRCSWVWVWDYVLSKQRWCKLWKEKGASRNVEYVEIWWGTPSGLHPRLWLRERARNQSDCQFCCV